MRRITKVLGGLLLLALCDAEPCRFSAQAQDTGAQATGAQEAADAKFQLPTSADSWLNSPPLMTDQLEGKAAFLWYFEEGCPRCRERWPAMYEAAKKFEGKPIVFIAVNSGSSREAIQRYVRDVQLPWPVIVDTNRTFEAKSDVGMISLQNIYRGKLLMPDGHLENATFDIEESVPRALAEAKWRVDPAEMPESLKPLWKLVEFGQFLAAAPQLKKAVNAAKPDEKAAAAKLMAAVNVELEKDVVAARAKYDAGNKWQAYKVYNRLSGRFKGYDLPEEVTTRVKELAATDAVKQELQAFKLFETAQKQQGPAALGVLKRIVKQFPDTESGQASQEILSKLDKAEK